MLSCFVRLVKEGCRGGCHVGYARLNSYFRHALAQQEEEELEALLRRDIPGRSIGVTQPWLFTLDAHVELILLLAIRLWTQQGCQLSDRCALTGMHTACLLVQVETPHTNNRGDVTCSSY